MVGNYHIFPGVAAFFISGEHKDFTEFPIKNLEL